MDAILVNGFSSSVAVAIESTEPRVRCARASQDAQGPRLHQVVVPFGLGDQKAEVVARNRGDVVELLFQTFELLFQIFELLFQLLYLPDSGVDLPLERGSPRLVPFDSGFGGRIKLWRLPSDTA
jgi:hypothetical protein